MHQLLASCGAGMKIASKKSDDWGQAMNRQLRVLVVDDERISRETTVQQLRNAGYSAESAGNAFLALERLAHEVWDVLVTDLRMPNMDGLEFLKKIKENMPEIDVVLMTAYGTVEAAVTAMHEGAADFLTKPFSFQELDMRLRKLANQREGRHQLNALKLALDQSHAHWGIVGKSAAMRRVFELVDLFGDNPAPVLITGETGTGKEMVARALHQRSARSLEPFIAVACGAIPKEVAESELLGHEKGAFTGAIQRRKGSFERAHRGTLLLDDVDDLPLDIQVKLMRALQDGTLQRVGGEEEVKVDVRVIASSKVDLLKAAEEGKIRKDIFYRLRGLEIALPPLRARGEDILLLAQHFLRVLAAENDSEAKVLSPETGDCLRSHTWPGNVRELQRAVESAVAVCREDEILPRHLPDYLRERQVSSKLYTLNFQATNLNFNHLIQEIEDEVIAWAMSKAGGEQQKAAELLGLPRTTFQSKLSRSRIS